MDDLDELNDFLKDAGSEILEGTAAAEKPPPTLEQTKSWRRTKAGSDGIGSNADLFDDDADGIGREFSEDASEDLTATMQLGELQGENRLLRKQVSALLARVRVRDEALALANEKLARAAAMLPGKQAAQLGLTTSAGPSSPKLSSSSSSNPAAEAPPGDGENTRGAKDLLLSKLGEFGFSAFTVENVLDDVQGSSNMEDVTVNEVLDRLLTGDDEAAGGGAGGGGGGGTTLGLDQGVMAQSSFLGRQGGGPKRGNVPTASQFGLFGDDGVSENSTPSAAPAGGGTADSTLFARVGAVSAEGKEPSARPGAKEDGKAVSYNEFLTRLMRPESGDLVQHMKLFISSVLGPNGDATPPQKQQQASLEYQFYGTHMLARRCGDFFEVMMKTLAAHPAWGDLGEAGLASGRNHLEK